jgi:PIN domain nuclease of toxin-antitoxin system
VTVVPYASAVPALLRAEPGSGAFGPVAGDAAAGAAGLAEAAERPADRGGEADAAREVIARPRSAILAVEAGETLCPSLLRGVTREAGLSPGDRPCLAAARAGQGRGPTADHSRADLDVGVRIEVNR